MSQRLRLALEGFSAFERQALQSYFRLSAPHDPAIEPGASLADCEFCVVDADRPAAVEAVRAARRQAISIYVGARAPEGAAAHLPRPIDPGRVARTLDALAGAARSARRPATPAEGASATRPPRTARPARAAVPASFAFDVLVVCDIDLPRRFLTEHLARLGCRVGVAASADEALAQLRERRVRIVFADMDPAGEGGLGLCQRIKQAGAGAPAVVLVGALASPSDRVRGLLSGCDAQLAKPLVDDELVAVLQAHGNRRRRAR